MKGSNLLRALDFLGEPSRLLLSVYQAVISGNTRSSILVCSGSFEDAKSVGFSKTSSGNFVAAVAWSKWVRRVSLYTSLADLW